MKTGALLRFSVEAERSSRRERCGERRAFGLWPGGRSGVPGRGQHSRRRGRPGVAAQKARKDAARNKATLVASFGLEGARRELQRRSGAKLAGASAASAALLDYGRSAGAAFQVADDILDAVGDPASLGKKVRKDAARNKATLVAAFGLEGARRELIRLVDAADAAIETSARLGEAGATLRAAARFIATRKS